MILLGIAVLLAGIALLVAEAHAPTAGVLGAAGAVGLGVGGWLLLDAAGAGVAVTLVLSITVAVVAFAVVLVGARKVLAARSRPPRGELARLVGETGDVRTWEGRRGQVHLGGALWRARLELGEEDPPAPGEPVVVERVEGLTLSVRRCEPWEAE